MMKKITLSFEKLESKVRRTLSKYPILYALIGGAGVVLFWRGIWHIADDMNVGSVISLIIGFVILILTGIFVSEFIGKQLIITGLIGEKKIATKEEGELETEESQLKNLQKTLNKLEEKLDHLDDHFESEADLDSSDNSKQTIGGEKK